MVRPTFLGFQTARKALNVMQGALNTVGHNISNVKTEGYTRQRVDIYSISSGSYAAKYAVSGSQFSGQGVGSGGIKQIRDTFLDRRFRNEACNAGYYSTKAEGLSDIQSLFNEIESGNGLSDEFSSFLNQLEQLSSSPNSREIAVALRTQAQELAQVLNRYSNELSKIKTQYTEELNIAVNNEMNVLLEKIASINQSIREDNIYGNPSNELMDERNMLLDELSTYVDINVKSIPETIAEGVVIERLQVTVKGNDDYVLIDNAKFSTLYVDESDPDNVRLGWFDYKDGSKNGDITEMLPNGSLRGHLDLLLGTGVYTGVSGQVDNSFRGVQYYEKTMDTFARTLAETLNTINSVVPGSDPPAYTDKPLFKSLDGGPITAANIAISDEWTNDAYNALTITAQLNPDGSVSNSPDNILKMLEQLKTSSRVFQASDGSPVFTGGFQEYITAYSSELGLDISLLESVYTTSMDVLTNVDRTRMNISAVSLDEEGIDLMTFQKAYNAAARLMTTLDEAVDTIVNRMGIVGR